MWGGGNELDREKDSLMSALLLSDVERWATKSTYDIVLLSVAHE